MALKAPIGDLTLETESWRCKFTEGRLRSRCCGLIEAMPVKRMESDGALTKFDKKVQFFHLTVAEFLQLCPLPNSRVPIRCPGSLGQFDSCRIQGDPFKDIPMAT